MGIPSPSFNQLSQVIFNYILYHDQVLKVRYQDASEDEKALIDQFQLILLDIETQLRASDHLSFKEIKQISASVHQKICKVFRSSIYQDISYENHVRNHFILISLKQELKIFKHTLSHQKEIEEKGLESFLDTSWGWKQLEQLARIGNLWALQTLRGYLSQNHRKAFAFLIRNHFFVSLHPLILEYKESSHFRENLQFMIEKSEKEKKYAYECIFAVLKMQNWDWGQVFLNEQLKIDPVATEICKETFEKQTSLNDFITVFILEQLLHELPLGIDCFAHIFSMPNPNANILIKPLIDMAFSKKSIHFDMLLLTFTAINNEKGQLKEEVLKIIDILEKERGQRPQSYRSILVDIIHKTLEFVEFLQQDDQDVDPSRLRADFHMASVVQMFALRKHELIDWLEKGMPLSLKVATPISEDFPQTSAVLVGRTLEDSYFANTIADLLAPHGVGIYAPVAFDSKDQLSISPSVTRWPVDYEFPIWLQDPCFIGGKIEGGNFYQYPYWAVVEKEGLIHFVRERIKAHHSQAYQQLKLDEFEFISMGMVNEQQLQFHLLRGILKTDPQMQNHRFQFTYNEGGNCLIGEEGGKAYAIIGKDAKDINKQWLTKELAKSGFKKNEQGRWELKEPYDEKELELTENDLKCFFAKDLGIEDPNRIYFIEQADYHLDMVMAIVEGKKVILNDSMVAYSYVYEEYQRKKEQLIKTPEKNQKIEMRMALLYKNAKIMKFLEDTAALDLKAQGFEVIRFAGVLQDIFRNHPENHRTNLFNFLSLTTPMGQRILISLGCEKRYQDYFKEMLDKYFKVDQLHFLDQNQSESLLKRCGGIRCITKRCAKRI